MPPPSGLVTVTIPQGQVLSNAADCTAGKPIAVIAPAAWDYSAGVSFQVSTDNITFYDLFAGGVELLSKAVVPGTCNIIPTSSDLSWIPYLRLRAGSRIKPVPQSAARTFTIILG